MSRRKVSTTENATTAGVELLPGEKIPIETTDEPRAASDEELNRKYIQGAIRIVTETARYSLAGILQMLQEVVEPEDGGPPQPRYQLDPEYQRRHRWNNERKSRLIESFLMNVPVPPVFLYERDLARFEVMDGRQRLTALSEFYDNKFALEGLQHWPELDGRYHRDLPSKVRDGIDRRYISSIILLKETASTEEQAAQLKKIVFERLNSGGVALSPQEARNAVYSGPLNDLCMTLSTNPTFRSMWGIPTDIDHTVEDYDGEDDREGATRKGRGMFHRMDDVELVLRFFAYRQICDFPGGLNKISAHLDKFLLSGNKFPGTVLDSYRAMFDDTVSLLHELLGAHAYCRHTAEGKNTGKPNKIVYDPIMYVASQHCLGAKREALLARKVEFRRELGRMYSEYAELFGGRRTNTADAQGRNVCMTTVFSAVSGTGAGPGGDS